MRILGAVQQATPPGKTWRTKAGVLPHPWVSSGCVNESRSGGLEAVIRVSLRPLISQEVCHDESGLRPRQEVKPGWQGPGQISEEVQTQLQAEGL